WELMSNVTPHDLGVKGRRIVRWIYLPLIFLTIGGMVAHNALIWRKKVLARRRQPRSVVRLTANQRVQHWLLLTSFIVLVLSGFALQYPDSLLAWLLGSNEYLRRIMHRVAALAVRVVGAYHLLYLAVLKTGQRSRSDNVPQST